MNEIAEGLRLGLDVDIYAKSEFNIDQMRQIKSGLEMGIDARKYAKIELT